MAAKPNFHFMLTVLLTVIAISASSACGSPNKTEPTSTHTIGWYQVDSENNIQGDILFPASDFTDLLIDTVPDGSLPYMYIQGRIVPERRNDWADTTEHMIGKRIGFLYNDSIITAPTINCRIESGNFQIISKDKELLKSLYKDLVSQSRKNE